MSILGQLGQWLGQRVGLSSPEDESFWRSYYGSENYSGKTVTQQTALQLSTVWACVRLLSETIATLPLNLYQLDAQGKPSVATGEILHNVLHYAPNAEMTAVDFWECMVASMLLWGNAYARKDRAGNSVIGLTPLRPEVMQMLRDANGRIIYRYNTQSGAVDYREDDILHIRSFSIDGLIGLSPIQYARNSMGSAMAIEEASATTFARGMRPGGVLEMDQVLKEDQRDKVRKNIVDKLAGVLNQGQMMVLEAGMKYHAITMNPEDAQMLESRAFSVEELCRWYRVPPFMVGSTEKTTSWGTGIEQQNIGFLTYSLRPYLKRIEQQVARSLIPPAKRGKQFAEFNLEGLLRADSAARAALYASFTQNGIKTRNEIRALENDPPLPGGDELTVQSNLVPLSMLGKTPPTAIPPGPTP